MSAATQNSSSLDPSICRDFLRNVCKRGRRCKFKHPAQNECEKIRRSERVFCHDFQNSTCNRPACKFLHYSREAEEVFRLTGRLPDEIECSSDGTRFQSTEEKPPVCKDYLNGLCSRGSACKYRHINDQRIQAQPLDSSTKFRVGESTTDTRSMSDLKPALCTTHIPPPVSGSHPSSLSTSINMETPAVQHQNILAFSSASHICMPPSAAINAVVVSAHDATLSATQHTPVVNVVDRLTIPSSSIQHTLYAHPSNLGTLTPLVSVSSTNHPVPCSSVLAVVADPGHPAVIQHPAAVATSQTAYHWVSNTQPPVQHHLLSTSSNVSSTPTLLTIPLTSFACDTNNHGPMIPPHPGGVCSTPQQPTVITSNSTLTNVSATCYPSYNLLHINQPPVIDNPSVTVLTTTPLTDKLSGKTSTTTSVSSSTTAALAAAAAAGYIAQHLPIMTAAQVTPVSDHSRNTTVPTCCAHFTPQTELAGKSQQSAALAAATNLPAVSAAAAAAVAAATAFAARTSTPTFAHDVHSGRNVKRCISPSKAPLLEMEVADAESESQPEASECQTIYGSTADKQPEYGPSPISSCNTTATTNTTTKSHAFSLPSKGNHLPSMGTHYPQDESAKTAAAVAAAACIGAMFSQPIGSGNSSPSSMAAMLGDLMCRNRRALVQTSQSLSEPREVCRSFGTQESLTPESSFNIFENKVDSPRGNSNGGDGDPSLALRENTSNAAVAEQFINDAVSASQLCTESQVYPPKPPSWSSVATTVASAAHAMAAAAVAATAAVTGSAKFFHMSKQQHQQKQLPVRSSIAPGFSVNKSFTAAPSPTVETSAEPIRTSSQSVGTSTAAPVLVDSPLSGSTERTSLSPNTAVTMTSAAAAAAMVAAAASAAAKQHQMISEMQIPSYPPALGRTCNSQSRPDIAEREVGFTEEAEYSVFDTASRYASAKRRVKFRPINGTRYEYSLKRCNAPRHQVLVEDDDDEDGDVYDDTESTMSLQASPEVTPPYTMPLKFTKHSEHVDVSYASHLDDSQPPSCETSPSDALFEPRTYRLLRRIRALNTVSTADSLPQRFDRKTDESKSRTVQQQPILLHSFEGCSRRVAEDILDKPMTRATNVLKLPVPIGTTKQRRTRSADSRPSFTISAATMPTRRSSSYPVLNETNGYTRSSCLQEVIASSPFHLRGDAPSEASASSGSMVEHLGSDRTREFSDNIKELEYASQCIASKRLRRLRRVSHLATHAENQGSISRMYRDKTSLKKSNRLRTELRPQLTASPDSVLTEEYSGHDDVDDMDTEYYDEDLFDMGDSEPSTKSSRTTPGKPSTSRCAVRRAPEAYNRINFRTTSMRKQHALKAENARLRRRLSDLLRQRGHLRAANEILLQQNARLRHSSKHVSAVARMAESATKIIEAHNKSQLVQPASQAIAAPVYRASGPMAVVAAPQQQTNKPELGGVYVSSTTASNSQQTPHAVAALSNPNSLFPSAVVASAVPGAAIALPSHQSLTAVQIQPSSETMVPTPVSTQTPIVHQHNESLNPRASLTNFYQHPLGHPLGTLSASITNVAHPNLAPVSSAIQVCHYPAPSGNTMYPSLPHATAANPSIVPVGAPSAVTLVLGQPPPTAYAPIGPQGPSRLHLANSLKTESTSVGSIPQLSYPYPGPSAMLAAVPQCPPSCSLASSDVLGSSKSLSLASSSSTAIDSNSTRLPQAPDYSTQHPMSNCYST